MDQVEFVNLVTKKVQSEFLNDIRINKDSLNSKERSFYNEMVAKVPLILDPAVLGPTLKTIVNTDNTIQSILVVIDGPTTNFMDKIN